MPDTPSGQAVGITSTYDLVEYADGTPQGREEPAQCEQGRGLACAVWSKKSHNLAFGDREPQTMHDPHPSITGNEVVDLDQVHTESAPPR
jgi:hypothetical protein